jgi:prepilin-type N-terminal cleavage/methylation domain-containing protein
MSISMSMTGRRMKTGRGFSMLELLIVLAISIGISVLAFPSLLALGRNYRSVGDGQDLYSMTGLAKMRAAADFTHARVYADLSGKSLHIEVWNKTSSVWTTEGGTQNLASGDVFGYGSFTSAPPNTQGTLGQAPACRDNSNTTDIANTACIIFNSRGIPIDNTSSPTGSDALYLTDGKVVYGVTVSATGLMRYWRGDRSSTTWSLH